jgi:hypothetical protein
MIHRKWHKPQMAKTEFDARMDCACACSALAGAGGGTGGGGGCGCYVPDDPQT